MNRCIICGSNSSFEPFGVVPRPNALCVECRSLERDRTLWKYLDSIIKPGQKILHVAPERCIFNKLSNDETIDYYPVDINPQYKDIRHVVDLMRLPYNECFFDIVICCNVLDEVPKDTVALKNIHKVLKNQGQAIINSFVKWGSNSTQEYDLSEKYEKIPYYGVKRRQYGKDYIARLESVGFKTYISEPNKNMSKKDLQRDGLISDDKVIVCIKE